MDQNFELSKQVSTFLSCQEQEQEQKLCPGLFPFYIIFNHLKTPTSRVSRVGFLDQNNK